MSQCDDCDAVCSQDGADENPCEGRIEVDKPPRRYTAEEVVEMVAEWMHGFEGYMPYPVRENHVGLAAFLERREAGK